MKHPGPGTHETNERSTIEPTMLRHPTGSPRAGFGLRRVAFALALLSAGAVAGSPRSWIQRQRRHEVARWARRRTMTGVGSVEVRFVGRWETSG